ncbi:hypothetical protein [Desulfosporosinus fructosivorans]
MKKLLIGITVCVLFITLLGCQSVTKPNNDIPAITENVENSEPNKPDSEPKKITLMEAGKIALEAAKKARETVPLLERCRNYR